MSTNKTVKYNIDADTSKFNKDLEKSDIKVNDVDRSLDKWDNSINQATTAQKKFNKSLAGAVVGAAAVAAGLGAIKVTGLIDQVYELGIGLGFTDTQIQNNLGSLTALAIQADAAGTSILTLGKAYLYFDKNLLKNEETLNSWGIATRDNNGELLSTQEIMSQLIPYLKEYSGEIDTATMASLFGSRGVMAVNQALSIEQSELQATSDALDGNTDATIRGAEAMDQMKVRASELAIIMTENLWTAMFAVIDGWNSLNPVTQKAILIFGGLAIILLTGLIPAMIALIPKLVKQTATWIKNTLALIANNIQTTFAAIKSGLLAIKTGILTAAKWLDTAATLALSAATWLLSFPIIAVTLLIVGIIAVVISVITYFGWWEEIIVAVSWVLEKIAGIIQWVINLIKDLVTWVWNIVSAFTEWLRALEPIEKVLNGIKGAVEALTTAITNLWNAIREGMDLLTFWNGDNFSATGTVSYNTKKGAVPNFNKSLNNALQYGSMAISSASKSAGRNINITLQNVTRLDGRTIAQNVTKHQVKAGL